MAMYVSSLYWVPGSFGGGRTVFCTFLVLFDVASGLMFGSDVPCSISSVRKYYCWRRPIHVRSPCGQVLFLRALVGFCMFLLACLIPNALGPFLEFRVRIQQWVSQTWFRSSMAFS
ncbi:hypothetical protein QBC45DRAFT_95943 [Copromyces sp. CBS 386.78]|nr:hypothetical protein QBC45DRAFT_95943 [Copromyces sp. CBS 386.78]